MAETGNGGIKPGSGYMKTSNQATTMLTHTGGEDFEYGQWNEIWLDLSRTDVSGGSNVVDDLHWHVYYSDETTPVHIDWDHMFVTEESFTRHYFHNDYLGSARLMTDEGGDIVWARDYRPYGDERNNSGNDDNPYKFTGKERDVETNLDYSWHRYYDYELGQFTQIDPQWDDLPSVTPYQYAINNPLKYIDPDGKIIVNANSQDAQTIKMNMEVTPEGAKLYKEMEESERLIELNLSDDSPIDPDTDKKVLGNTRRKVARGVYKPGTIIKVTIYLGHQPTSGKSMGKYINGVGCHEAVHATRHGKKRIEPGKENQAEQSRIVTEHQYDEWEGKERSRLKPAPRRNGDYHPQYEPIMVIR